ncbi:MAG: YeeE/YedE family protein [Dehalococcoidia bacterium]|nr:YeeE/YedE family protein [Dehalococcoidia bacterium]
MTTVTVGQAKQAVPDLRGVVARALVVALLIAIGLAMAAVDSRLAVFWAFGVTFGFILQRSRFCFASAFRDLFLLQDGRVMKAVLGGLAIATVGFALVQYNLTPSLAAGRLPFNAGVVPLGLHLLLGGVLFGVGMVVAGGCTSGSLYRIGEGYVGSLVAVGGMMVGLAFIHFTWNWWWENYISRQPLVWLPPTLGWGGAVVLVLLVLAAAASFIIWIESRASAFAIVRPASPQEDAAGFSAKLRSLLRSVFVKGWPAIVGGVALGGLNVMFYLFERPVGVVNEVGRWSEGVLNLIGLPPPAHAGGVGPCAVTDASPTLLTWGLMINGGIILGSFAASVLAGEFRLRVPRQARRYGQSFGGGILMGYGAGLAAGCTLGGFFSAIPSLGLNGWFFGASLAVGALIGIQVIRRIS